MEFIRKEGFRLENVLHFLISNYNIETLPIYIIGAGILGLAGKFLIFRIKMFLGELFFENNW
jgi:hypothetical protein